MYLAGLARTGQIKECIHLYLEYGHANAYYPRCEKNWASRVPANNVVTDITAYRAPSSYSWPKCPDDCPYFEKSVSFTHTASRDQYAKEDTEARNQSWSDEVTKEEGDKTPMNEFALTDEQLNTIKIEVEKWQEFLNLTVGTLSFTMGLATLSVKHIWAWFALAFLIALVFPQMKKWPPTLKGLRDKKDKTDRERIIYRGLMDEFFGFSALLKNFAAFWIGVAFLLFVATNLATKIELLLN